jgi:cytochrome P450
MAQGWLDRRSSHLAEAGRMDGHPETFPFDRRCPFAVPAEYDEFRQQEGPVRVRTRPGPESWLATRYEQVRALLADDRLSNDRSRPGYPTPIAIPKEFTTGGSLLTMDPPRHAEYRRLVAAEFSFHKVRLLRPRIQEIVDECIDAMVEHGPPIDLHVALGIRVTMSVVTGMLGISFEDVEFMRARTRVMFDGTSSVAARGAAVRELDAYFLDIVHRKHAQPEDDLISRVVARFPEPKDFDELAKLTRLLLNGGHDSTASMVSLGVLTLLEHPDQLKLLRDNPSLAPQAVEELLRFLTVTDLSTARVARDRLTVGGVDIEPGEGVYPSTAAANRDPLMFDRPDEFDISRGSRTHLAFGHGRHLCLGMDVARAELELTYTTLLRRLPELRLAVPFEELRYREGGLVYGLQELPVTW